MKILLVEDNPGDAILLRAAMVAGGAFEVKVATRLDEAIRLAGDFRHEAVLLDLSLPDSQGLATVTRARSAWPALPIVVLTGLDDESVGIDALRAGAQDYLVKGRADGRSLTRAIRYAAERKQMEDQRERLLSDLRQARDELEQRVATRTADLATTVAELQSEVRDRMLAEDALRESEERYRSVVEMSPSAIGVLEDGEFIYVNKACVSLFGAVGPGQLLGRPVLDMVDKQGRRRFGARVDQATARGSTVIKDQRIVRLDGRLANVEGVAARISFGGRPAMLLVLEDVTERKDREGREGCAHRLLELFAGTMDRKKYLDAVAGAIHDWSGCRHVGVRITDGNGDIPYEAYIGFDRKFLEMESRLSLAGGRCICMRVISGQAEPQDEPLLTAGGSVCCENSVKFLEGLPPAQRRRYRGTCMKFGFLSLAVVPIRYRGKTYGAIHLADEREGLVPPASAAFIESMAPLIGEAVHRFNVEQELRREYEKVQESEERYRFLFDAAPLGIGIGDRDGRILAANRSLRQIMGLTEEQMKGVNIATFYANPDQRNQLFKDMEDSGRVRDWEARLKRDDGGEFPALLNIDKVKLDGQEVLFTTLRDITDRRQLEQEVLRVGEAERRRIGQDLHDGLGQNLTGLSFMARVLQQRLEQKQAEESKDVAEFGKLLRESISLARSLSRGLNPGGVQGESLVIALRDMAANVREMFGVACSFRSNKQALVEDEVAGTHLYRIAQEAINNAMKHGKARHVAVSLLANRGHITLSVKDDGVGLPEMKTKPKGMGLRTMHYRATSIGASFQAARRPEGGTVVTCRLPVGSREQ